MNIARLCRLRSRLRADTSESPFRSLGPPGPVGSIPGPLAGRSGNRSAICVSLTIVRSRSRYGSRPDPAPRTASPSGKARAMTNGRPAGKRPARWSPFAGIARIRSLGVAVQPLRCPASQPSRRDSGYPAVGAVQLPRSPRRQYRRCTARRTGAQGRKPRHARAERRVPGASSSTDPAP
jgi:hypothetical protein